MVQMKRRVASAALFLALAAAPASAFDLTDMTDAERQAFRAEVREYLMENPQVLMEAIGVLEDRQAREQAGADAQIVADNADEIFRDGRSWEGGNPDGDVTLVEFIDYRCGYCRRAHDEVADLMDSDGEIRFIIKEFPILGEESLESARFAIATRNVAGPEKYKAASDALIKLRGTVNEAALMRVARDIGVDADEVLARMKDTDVTEELQANHDLARKLNISGTPTFILGDQLLRGYVPLAQMRDMVEDVRKDG